MKPLKSKKGFYLVSPFLGTFFFLITVSIAALFMTEDAQQLETAKAGGGNDLVFTSFTIQADAFDVYFQNYLQQVLNDYVVGSDVAFHTKLVDEIKNSLSSELGNTYTNLYRNAFGIDCEVNGTAWSYISVSLNNQVGVDIVGCGEAFCPNQKTAIWPYISRYSLRCSIDEPPVETWINFRSRWYYLDGSNICRQAPNACDL